MKVKKGFGCFSVLFFMLVAGCGVAAAAWWLCAKGGAQTAGTWPVVGEYLKQVPQLLGTAPGVAGAEAKPAAPAEAAEEAGEDGGETPAAAEEKPVQSAPAAADGPDAAIKGKLDETTAALEAAKRELEEAKSAADSAKAESEEARQAADAAKAEAEEAKRSEEAAKAEAETSKSAAGAATAEAEAAKREAEEARQAAETAAAERAAAVAEAANAKKVALDFARKERAASATVKVRLGLVVENTLAKWESSGSPDAEAFAADVVNVIAPVTLEETGRQALANNALWMLSTDRAKFDYFISTLEDEASAAVLRRTRNVWDGIAGGWSGEKRARRAREYIEKATGIRE